MQYPVLRLKKNEERRILAGHLWIYSNEIDTKATPLKNFVPGSEALIETYDKKTLGVAYVNPHSLISARLVTRKANEAFDQDLLTQRLQVAYQWRQRLYPDPFYRLVFAEGDFLPGLIIDRYDDTCVMQLNTAGMAAKQDLLIQALKDTIPNLNSVLLRNDSPLRLQEGLETSIDVALGEPPEKILLKENNSQFYAPLWSGQKTGWFYDHRLNRSRLENYVKGLRVLDVFSYLGAWGIQAANYGAASVCCLDASATAIELIKENAKLNHLNNITTICDDAFDGLKSLAQQNEKFDVIILDPPAFVKKLKDKKEGQLAYQRINELALRLLNPQGLLFSCSCSMHMSEEDLLLAISRASNHAKIPVQLIERGSQAPDHPVHVAIPETNYLKMIVVKLL